MNIEDYREFCLSLGEDIEEKLPFQKFKNGEGVLVFSVLMLNGKKVLVLAGKAAPKVIREDKLCEILQKEK